MGDPVAKTYRVKLALPDDTPLMPGMSLEANIVTREKPDALLVPRRRAAGRQRSSSSTAQGAGAQGSGRHSRHARSRDHRRAEGRRPRRFTGLRRLPDGSRVRVASPAAAMNLILDIALTHVRSRARQTLVAVAGVATGVGFSIMMAALMQGSQDDFIRQLVNALPHITVSDERRHRRAQPAETAFGAAADSRPDARGAPARHQESACHHGRARSLGARRRRALRQGAGHHPLCQRAMSARA